jgi:hypothetical protein
LIAVRFCISGMVALTATSCADATDTSSPAPSLSSAPTPESSASPAAEVDLVALIESIPGYTYAPAPEVEQAFASELGEAGPPVVRAVLLSGEPQGNVIISSSEQPVSDEDLRNLLAGAEAGGNKVGTATRREIAGRPAVKTVREDGAVIWTTAKGRYSIIVATRPEVADDLTRQVLERLLEVTSACESPPC